MTSNILDLIFNLPENQLLYNEYKEEYYGTEFFPETETMETIFKNKQLIIDKEETEKREKKLILFRELMNYEEEILKKNLTENDEFTIEIQNIKPDMSFINMMTLIGIPDSTIDNIKQYNKKLKHVIGTDFFRANETTTFIKINNNEHFFNIIQKYVNIGDRTITSYLKSDIVFMLLMKIIDENNMIIDYDIIIMIVCLCFQKYDGSIMLLLHGFVYSFLEFDPDLTFSNLMTKKYINFEANKILLTHDDTYIIKPYDLLEKDLTNENILVISEIKINFDLSNKTMELEKFLFSNKRSNITYPPTTSQITLEDNPITNLSLNKSQITGLSVLASSVLVGSLLLFTPLLGGKSKKMRKYEKKYNKQRKSKKIKKNKTRKMKGGETYESRLYDANFDQNPNQNNSDPNDMPVYEAHYDYDEPPPPINTDPQNNITSILPNTKKIGMGIGALGLGILGLSLLGGTRVSKKQRKRIKSKKTTKVKKYNK
jgi:hypothetical protein